MAMRTTTITPRTMKRLRRDFFFVAGISISAPQ
jgi:hypothetical protein